MIKETFLPYANIFLISMESFCYCPFQSFYRKAYTAFPADANEAMDMIRHEHVLPKCNRMTLRGTCRLVKDMDHSIISQQSLFLPRADCHKINRIWKKDIR